MKRPSKRQQAQTTSSQVSGDTTVSTAASQTPENHPSPSVVHDADNALGFDVDWDTIEKNYQHRHRHHSTTGTSDDAAAQQTSGSPQPAKKKRHIFRKILLSIFLFLFCVVIGITAAFFILRHIGQQTLLDYDQLHVNVPDGVDYKDGGDQITYDGHTYRFNKNIASVLFMGIDNTELKENATAGTAGQADALYLFAYDTVTGSTKVLCLNRDTMADISRYDESGTFHDTTTAQLCLAYAYGDGKTLSAENQVTAVQRLIYNVPIHSYYAIDLSAIKILNDDVGGVTLTPDYTFGSFTKGEQITILGDMAEEFVRSRDVTLVDDNLRRMACQRQYIDAFVARIIPAIREDFGTPIRLYQDSSRYTVTNITAPVLTYLASTAAVNHSGLELITTEGKYVVNKESQFPQYKIDKKKLFESILSIFYTKID